MVSLTLTENPGLQGSIPLRPDYFEDTYGWPLKSLDLHSNAFDGNLSSNFFSYYYHIEDLDLSNNRLEGLLPESLGFNQGFRTIRVSNNILTGIVSKSITLNWTKIIIADFSYNKFVGHIPNLSNSPYLYNLNISHNNFVGDINLSTILNPQTNKSLTILDLSDNKFTGPMPDVGYWTNLQSLNLSSNMFDVGPLPFQGLKSLQGLQTLGLSNTSLNGKLNLSLLCDLNQGLKIIELDNNNFTGALDIDSYISLRCSSSLQYVRLKHNQIDKVIFSARSVLNLSITIDLTGNPFCNSKKTDIRRCLCEQLCYDTKTNSGSIIIGFVIGGSLGGITIIIASILLWKSRKERRYLLLAVHQKFAEYEMKPTLFSYSALERATRNFHLDMKVGEGAFGVVYKGKLADGSEVAVKQLFTKAQQNMDDFLNEVVLLTSVKHRNLVKLKGCCLHGNKRLLVYEYLDNYDLADTLFGHKGNQLITWPARFNICLGVAHGLHYLHAGVDQRILHRDVKASNVLLDHNLFPKIADFGLAMLFPNEESHVTVQQVAGTMGYLAPEYATQGQLSDKVDVFSFGVLALEVVSGRKNIDFDAPPNKTYLIEWAWRLNEEGRLMDLVDPILSIQFDEKVVVQRVITIALACLQTTPDRRPTMAQVVGMLQGDIESSDYSKGRVDEEINQVYCSLLGLNNTTTTLLTRNEENPTFVPRDEERQALYLGDDSSSSNFHPRAIQLSTINSR